MTLANKITVGRILLIPPFVACLIYYDASARAGAPEEWWRYAAIICFAVASISDGVDGYLARHWNQRSELGAVLDPIADKLLQLAALIVLAFVRMGAEYPFPLWFPIVILSRDAILLIGFVIFHFMSLKVAVRPHWTGKVSMFFTLIAILSALLKLEFTVWLCAAGAICALISIIIYVGIGMRLLTGTRAAHPTVRE